MQTPEERGAQFAAAICAAPNYERQSAAERLRELETRLNLAHTQMCGAMHDLTGAIIVTSELRDPNLITMLDDALARTMHEHDRLLGYRRYASGALAYLQTHGSLWS